VRANVGIKLALAIPTYNRAVELVNAIESVLPLSDAVDLHVFDNASTDGTRALTSKFDSSAIHFHWSAINLGFVGNMNRILTLSSDYDWVGILHSDDRYVLPNPDELIQNLLSLPPSGIAFGSHQSVNQSRSIISGPVITKDYWPAGAAALGRAQSGIACSTMWYSSEAIHQTGCFDRRWHFSADEEYSARVAVNFGIASIPLLLAERTKHPGNLAIDLYRDPSFPEEFTEMRLHMNSLLPKEEQLRPVIVRRKAAAALLNECSALCAYNEMTIVRRFYRFAMRVDPRLVLDLKNIFRFFFGSFPSLRSRFFGKYRGE